MSTDACGWDIAECPYCGSGTDYPMGVAAVIDCEECERKFTPVGSLAADNFNVSRSRQSWHQALDVFWVAEGEECRVHATLAAIMAFGALEAAVQSLRDAGAFSTKKPAMRGLMRASRVQGVYWLDYEQMEAAIRRRNLVAHGAGVLSLSEVRRYIESIAAQLIAWGVI